MPVGLLAQNSTLENYIAKHKSVYQLDDFAVNFGESLTKNDMVFWGYIHGSETPQLVEYKLLEYLVENGFQYYMPEIGMAQAYFLNQYLETGNQDLLLFAGYYQKSRTSQDASIQFIEKWKKIYQLNKGLPQDKKLTVLGADVTLFRYDPTLAITYLAYIAPSSDIPMIDSLKYMKNLDILDINVISGKPAWDAAMAAKKSTYDFIYPLDSKYQFARRFFNYYLDNKEEVQEAFGDYGNHVERLLIKSEKRREATIYDNFKRDVAPLIAKGGKVFSSYGYAHVMQGPINKNDYLAGLIKKGNPEISTTSVLGLLAKSNALNNRKLRKTGTLEGPQGFVFESAEYNGYTTKKSYDGDSFFERVDGIQHLKKATRKEDILTLSLIEKESPFNQGLTFVDFKKGGKRWNPDTSLNTLDYFQFVIYIQNSAANIPIEELGYSN